MKFILGYVCFFLFACDIHGKDIYLDLELDLPNKSSVSIEYQDRVSHFSPEEMIAGALREHVFDVVIYSNVKDGVEVLLSSSDSVGDRFMFIQEDQNRKLPFELFLSEEGQKVRNGETIFSQELIEQPVAKVISMGIKLPKASKKDIFGGKLSTHFTVILKHVG